MLQRAISIAIGVPLFLTVLFWPGGWPFTGLVMALALLALREFYDGCRRSGAAPGDGAGYAAVLVLIAAAVPLLDSRGSSVSAFFPGPRSVLLLGFGLTLVLLLSLVAELGRAQRAPLRNLGSTWFGVVYVGWLFPFLARLRWAEASDLERIGASAAGSFGSLAVDPGARVLLLLLLLTWSVDTLAYLVGRALGRHKLAPNVSPNKTWEGAAGGFLGAMAVSAAVGTWLRFPLAWALSAGALVGILAQLGDLCKSAMKREIGIKDFGALLPGHGGILDRFDSLLFTGPAVYWLLVLWPS